MAGARPAAPIAAAWAILNALGEQGYVSLARTTLETTRKIQSGIAAIPGLGVFGEPAMSVMSFGSDTLDIMAIGDVLDDRGWHLDRQEGPDALHMMISPIHAQIADRLLADLREAAEKHGPSRGKQARYS
jgi:glutamate/tyrosine decarboxylase-like PLP-dependent enzyme